MHNRPSIDLSYRLGASVLATVAGAVVGLLLGVLMLQSGLAHSLARSVAGGAIAGALAGALLPTGAMDFVEGTIHFFAGLLVASSKLAIDDDTSSLYQGEAERPKWLHWVFIFGAIFAVVLWVLSNL